MKEIERIIGDQAYSQKKVNQWTATIVWLALESLVKINRKLKYVMTCTIMEKNPEGLHTACCCSKDSENDSIISLNYLFK
jgi:hypothetical protein